MDWWGKIKSCIKCIVLEGNIFLLYGTFSVRMFCDGMFSDGMFCDGMFSDGMFSDWDVQ